MGCCDSKTEADVETEGCEDLRENAKNYYGDVLGSSDDLKTTACCSSASIPEHHKSILGQISDEVMARFYGCGSPIPTLLEGMTVLDLGCGTGRDVYLCSKLVGPTGRVIGLDMTDEQLEVARRNLDEQMKTFGFDTPNVEFRAGVIEDLAAAGIEDDSVDVVISNCVLNLSPDKGQVLSEVFRVLRPGGELYFSDVYADRRISDELLHHPVIHGECLGGALYLEDFRRILDGLGCPDFRSVESAPIEVTDPAIAALTGNIAFESITVRAFKLDALEDAAEDYGQIATYKGSDPSAPHSFVLDDEHVFETGRPRLVDGNTAAMLQQTRFAEHFDVIGDRRQHFGLFDESGSMAAEYASDVTEASSSGCC